MKAQTDIEKRLEDGIEELRALEVPEHDASDAASNFFERLNPKHAQSPARPRLPWRLPMAMTMVAATAAALTWLTMQPHEPAPAHRAQGEATIVRPEEQTAPTAITRLGARVTFLADVGARFAVEVVTGKETRVRLAEGTVTVRLLPGAAPHKLSIDTIDHSFQATGTVYSVNCVPVGTTLQVHQGVVAVFDAQGTLLRSVPAGEIWQTNTGGSAIGTIAATRLLEQELAPFPWQKKDVKKIAQKMGASSSQSSKKSNSNAPEPTRPEKKTPELPPSEQLAPEAVWKEARLLRAQNRPREALTLLHRLASQTDKTWAALALIETIRILSEEPVGIREPHRRLLRVARQFGTQFPTHSLMGEVERIVCPLPNAPSALPACKGK